MQDKKDRFLQQLNAKEVEAFKELFREFYGVLVQFSVNYVGQQDVAEDIVEDVFVSLWEKSMRFLTYNAFRSFLYNSVRNASLNYLKHKNVEEIYLASLGNEKETEDDVDLKIMEEELYRLLFDTIDKLPEKCRNIFLLHLEGKGNEEIATLLKLSILTVKTQKKRAMQFIRKHLGDVYFLLLSMGII
ncbi:MULTISPECIES: RNA polymerase sigma-70 factor [Butyricimonas]|uniref:RNA polymerase sigma-70 factor n=1 Tax=Butyricimonas TaxID=574697 RepID=UPI0007FB2F91|nr:MULTISPECIES: RNA polymerase sigma-70 factor [Butyricimonas]